MFLFLFFQFLVYFFIYLFVIWHIMFFYFKWMAFEFADILKNVANLKIFKLQDVSN